MMRGAPDKEDKMTLNELLPIIAIPLVIILVLVAVFSMWKKVPQDKAGVITGLKRRVITGGGGLVIPGVERIDYISLGNMPLRVDTRGSLSSQGVPISVSTTAVIKVRNSPDAILTNAASGRKTCRSGQPQHPAAGFPLHHGWHGGCP